MITTAIIQEENSSYAGTSTAHLISMPRERGVHILEMNYADVRRNKESLRMFEYSLSLQLK